MERCVSGFPNKWMDGWIGQRIYGLIYEYTSTMERDDGYFLNIFVALCRWMSGFAEEFFSVWISGLNDELTNGSILKIMIIYLQLAVKRALCHNTT